MIYIPNFITNHSKNIRHLQFCSSLLVILIIIVSEVKGYFKVLDHIFCSSKDLRMYLRMQVQVYPLQTLGLYVSIKLTDDSKATLKKHIFF